MRFVGEVRALDSARLAAGAAGAVTSVSAREGDRVSAGEVLLEVDPSLAGAELAAARAAAERGRVELAQAKRDLARVEQIDAGVLAPSEVEAARARVEGLEAELRRLEASARLAGAQLGRHRIVAPFDGVVTDRLLDPGDWATPGAPALGLVSADALEVRAEVSLDVVVNLTPGSPVQLQGRGPLEGRVLAVVPALDPGSRTALLRVEPGEHPRWLLPGAVVDVLLDIERADAGVVVPRDALVLGPVEQRVVKVVDGAAAPVSVEVLARSDVEVLVRSDELADGDTVVVRGNERLRAGQSVQVSNFSP